MGGPTVTYRLPKIQNDLIVSCGDVIYKVVVEDVKASPFFSVLADKASDVSNHE